MPRFIASILLTFLVFSRAAADPASRVAVVSDADDKDLAALVTTELSSSAGLVLLERDDLAKIGDEAKA